jgi:hypothetical protein
MSQFEREASEFLASALSQANLSEFHQAVGGLLEAYLMGGVSQDDLVEDIAALYVRTEQANKRLHEAADRA